MREALLRIRARIGDDPGWRIVVRTDSLGVINWLQRTWKRHKNLDLYPTIDPLIDARVRFEHVRGHSGNPGNERVDALAVEETMRILARRSRQAGDDVLDRCARSGHRASSALRCSRTTSRSARW